MELIIYQFFSYLSVILSLGYCFYHSSQKRFANKFCAVLLYKSFLNCTNNGGALAGEPRIASFTGSTLKKRLNYMTNSLSSGPRKGLLRIYQRKTATKGVNWAITKCKTCEYRRQLNVYVLCCSNNSNSCSCNISNSSSNKNLQSPRLICSITVGKTRPTVSSTSSLARLIHDVYGYLSLSQLLLLSMLLSLLLFFCAPVQLLPNDHGQSLQFTVGL